MRNRNGRRREERMISRVKRRREKSQKVSYCREGDGLPPQLAKRREPFRSGRPATVRGRGGSVTRARVGGRWCARRDFEKQVLSGCAKMTACFAWRGVLVESR